MLLFHCTGVIFFIQAAIAQVSVAPSSVNLNSSIAPVMSEEEDAISVDILPEKNTPPPIPDDSAPERSIINGQRARPNEFPFLVSIQNLDRPNVNFCGGTLITQRHVLTAAHCLERDKADNVVVSVGRLDITNPAPESMFRVSSIKIHENYDKWVLVNDIALITLTSSVPITESTRTVTIAGSVFEPEITNDILIAAGWGLTVGGDDHSGSNRLMKAYLPVIGFAACKKIFGEMITPETQICVGNNMQSTCEGDSGGPLLRRSTSGKLVQVGLTSYGVKFCKAGTANVFTKVSQFLPWIRAAVNADSSSRKQNSGRRFG